MNLTPEENISAVLTELLHENTNFANQTKAKITVDNALANAKEGGGTKTLDEYYCQRVQYTHPSSR